MTFEIIFVLLALVGMVIALILDKMRPGMVLFSVVVLFLCAGILTPKEMLEGFSNKGMITVAMLFLVSEGIRQSGALGQLIKKLLPQGKTTVFKAQLRMLPIISFISAFLNTAKELFFDPYRANKATGSFILIDPITNNTSAVGMIIDRVEDKDMHLSEELPVLDLPKLGILPGQYEAVEKAVKELERQGIAVIIKK